MKLVFQRPAPVELAEINQLVLRSKASWGYPKGWIDLWASDLAITKQKLEQREFWLARDNAGEALALYSFCQKAPGDFELEDFWLAPASRGTGLGRAMFTHLLGQLANHRARQLTIIADPNAEGFYVRMGAVKIGTFESQPIGRLLPVMRLTL